MPGQGQGYIYSNTLHTFAFPSALEWVNSTYPRTKPTQLDLLADLIPTDTDIPRKSRIEQIQEMWDIFIKDKPYKRKPLLFISGVSGSGKSALARYFAETQEVDIEQLAPEKQVPHKCWQFHSAVLLQWDITMKSG